MLPEEVLKDVETLQHALGWEKYSAQPVASGTGEPVVWITFVVVCAGVLIVETVGAEYKGSLLTIFVVKTRALSMHGDTVIAASSAPKEPMICVRSTVWLHCNQVPESVEVEHLINCRGFQYALALHVDGTFSHWQLHLDFLHDVTSRDCSVTRLSVQARRDSKASPGTLEPYKW